MICKWFKKREPETNVGIGEQVPKEVALCYQAMLADNNFHDPRYIAEINYGLNSKHHRLFVYDRKLKRLHTHKCAHGSGGANARPHDGYTREVSNTSGSHMSCLGLFKTGETYYGSNGYSMRLHGLSDTNDAAYRRAIVMHKSGYVKDSDASICGRSWGCPSVDPKYYKRIIDMLKDGSPIYSHFNGKLKI